MPNKRKKNKNKQDDQIQEEAAIEKIEEEKQEETQQQEDDETIMAQDTDVQNPPDPLTCHFQQPVEEEEVLDQSPRGDEGGTEGP